MKDGVTRFKTGAIRDDQSGKFDIAEYMSPLALGRFYEWMRKSAEKYGAGNWRKGIPPDSALKSLRRHLWLVDLKEYGVDLEPDTDHLAAAMFNIMIKLHDEEVEKLKLAPEKYHNYPLGSFNEEICRKV